MPIDKLTRESNKQKENILESEIQKLQSTGEHESKLADLYKELQKISVGWDFKDKDNKPYDYAFDFASLSHGTPIAGIASKESDDISILPIRLSFSEAKIFYKAIELAHSRGSRIVNMSFGGFDKDSDNMKFLDTAMKDNPDMLFVVVAGNDGEDLANRPTYPAASDYSNVIVVASVDENNELSDFSSYNKTMIDIAALGRDVLSPEPGNTYNKRSGTSFAAPQVTRVAAKVKFINPDLTPEQIIAIIRDSVTPIESLKDTVTFGGVLNEEKAIELAKMTLQQSPS